MTIGNGERVAQWVEQRTHNPLVLGSSPSALNDRVHKRQRWMPTQSHFYDRHLRNPRSKAFYNSADWKRLRDVKLAQTCWCERCNDPARHVHHKIPITEPEGWEKRLDIAGLMSVCIPCHNEIEGQDEPAPIDQVCGILEPVEDDEFYFDEEAADRAVRFIERYVRHFEGKWAGENLKLLDWQRQLVRTLYGWKRRDNGNRRFRELFLLSAKGCGKTPLLSAIGQYELIAGGEEAAHVVSMATDYQQAYLTMEWAKKSIEQDPQLSKRCEIVQREIRHPKTNAKWTPFSGTFKGRSGFRPSCVLADEAHEWPNSKLYDTITANLFKRSQPLLLIATNAGESRNCFAWTLYESAKAVLAGKSPRKDLLPVIFEAPESMEWTSEEAARLACPSIPEVVPFESLLPAITAARGNPRLEAKYRRLHLSHWVRGGSAAWLDIAQWDAVTDHIDPEVIKNAPLYVGLDLSEGDDLCAAALVWVTPDRLYVDFRLWVPRITAQMYEAQDAGRYTEWEEQGYITLLESPTIGPNVRRAIAGELVELKPHMICYDRYRADEATAVMEAAGIKSEKIGSGWGTSPGCSELERRLTDRSVTIAPNAVARAAAEAVEVTQDGRGNIWCIKPNQRGKYAGTRSVKIDPVVALTLAMVEARKHQWPVTQKVWSGIVEFV
jgi:phage terminase large subunit-like protein